MKNCVLVNIKGRCVSLNNFYLVRVIDKPLLPGKISFPTLIAKEKGIVKSFPDLDACNTVYSCLDASELNIFLSNFDFHNEFIHEISSFTTNRTYVLGEIHHGNIKAKCED